MPRPMTDDAAHAELLDTLRNAIAETVARRDQLKRDMKQWYADAKPGRFPGWGELEAVDRRLSDLDARFKRAYDAGTKPDRPGWPGTGPTVNI
jgi:hypothetical protein